MKINYVIVDDEPMSHRLIQRFAANRAEMVCIGNCYNAREAQDLLQQQPIDLVFLDIQMPAVSGFELLSSSPVSPAIIIVSAHQEYALESYEYSITDYLLKPFDLSRFQRAADKALKQIALNRGQQPPQGDSAVFSDSKIFIKDDKKHHQVSLQQIQYIKANGNYTSVFLDTGSIVSQMKISEFENLLPEQAFSRVHRSYLVRHGALTMITASELAIGDTVIPVGRVYKQQLSKVLFWVASE